MKMDPIERSKQTKADKLRGVGWRWTGLIALLALWYFGASLFEQIIAMLACYGIAELCDLNAQARKNPWG